MKKNERKRGWRRTKEKEDNESVIKERKKKEGNIKKKVAKRKINARQRTKEVKESKGLKRR